SPVLFAKEILSDKVEYSLTVSPDKKTIYFVKTDSFYVSKPKAIYKSVQENGDWSVPQKVWFSNHPTDSNPFLTPDGKRLFFTSRRPVKGKKVESSNIWYVDIVDGKEGEPQYLEGVNSTASEYSPTTDKNGNLYFGSYREGGHGWGDIWWSEYKDGQYQPPQNMGANINTKHGEWGSCIAPNGNYLIFENSGRSENQSASGDLYIAFKENGVWQKAKHFKTQLNTIGSDLTPKIHGDTFYFASNRKHEYQDAMILNNVDLYSIPIQSVLASIKN
ncbi:MAG: hypothetical protein AAFO07_33560, partial [Bacteroidota bacterium]